MTENIIISTAAARAAALAGAGLNAAEFTSHALESAFGRTVYTFEFETGELIYTACVDANSGECVGLDQRPRPEPPCRVEFTVLPAARMRRDA